MFKISLLCALIGSSAFAASETLSLNSVSASASQIHDTMNIAAKNKAEALQTESMFYSLPRAEMTFIELGAYTQKQNVKMQTEYRNRNLNNQAFFFKHSRGLNDYVALDFAISYFMLDGSADRSSGVNETTLGLRSSFEALDLNWVYGGNLGYIPNGEYQDGTSRVALTANIGFEEAVDIARWGVQMEGTSKDSYYSQNQMHLIGFFEIPFVQKLNMGVSAGVDLTRLNGSDQNNFASVYGQYAVEAVSAVQLSLKQINQKSGNSETTDAEVGLSLNRVF
jgi:hypothetical protein